MLTLKGKFTNKQRKIAIPITDFKGGVNKVLSEGRLGLNEAKEATNLMQVEDGLWKPRWGTAYYGADHGDTVDGAHEYLKSDGSTELITIAGGKAYKSTDGGTLTEVTGATFTADTQCYFLQIGGYLYIVNGTDNMARYDGSTLSTYSSLSAPSGVSSSLSGLSSGTYTMYCEVTAVNSVGETTGSTEASVSINRIRDQWTASDYITWTCSAVASAAGYQWYISEATGQEAWVASTEKNSWVDDGTNTINTYITPPLGNTTTGPKVKSMCVSGNRIWATNSTASDAGYMVYFSGTGVNMGTFSEFFGGGWINLEKGGREQPIAVKHYQSGSGEGRATALCKTPEGQGAVWQLEISSATIGSVSFSVPSAVKVVGSSGTDSILGVVATENDIMFPNKRGWYSLGPEKNYYGILRTNEISLKVRDYWRSLLESDKVAAYFKEGKIFVAVCTTGTTNNRVIIYDLEKTNWTVDWTLAVKQFLEYTDTNGISRFLYVPYTGNKLIEISENISGDLGSAFSTSYYSGRWPVAKLFKDFIKVNKVHIKLNAPKGTIQFEILGSEKNKSFASLVSKTMTSASTVSLTGLGWDQLGSCQLGSTAGTPTYFADSAVQRYVKIRKKIREIQFHIATTAVDADYTLLGWIVEGNALQINPPSGERLN